MPVTSNQILEIVEKAGATGLDIKMIEAAMDQVDLKEKAHGERIIPVLGIGYLRHRPEWIMGNDIEVVNDARTSFNVEHSLFYSRADASLVRYLGNHGHTSCFRGLGTKFEIYMPLMVARQLWKYIIGSQHEEEIQADEYSKYQDSMTNWNEVSRRYVKENMEFYLPGPDQWRSAPENAKQGSGVPLDENDGAFWTAALDMWQKLGVGMFESATRNNMCAEQARLFIPAYGLMVRSRWTLSLQTACHFISQRIEHAAQFEIQQYALAMYHILKDIFKYSLHPLLNDDVKKLLAEAEITC